MYDEKIRKKYIIVGIASLLIIIIMAYIVANTIITIKGENKKQEIQKASDNYKIQVYEYTNAIIESMAKLEVVGNAELRYWYDRIYNNKYASIDDAVKKALEDNATIVKEIKSNSFNINKKYVNTQKLPEVTDDTLEQLKEKSKELYDIYYDFYYFILTPRGNYEEFSTKFGEYDSAGAKKYREIRTLLEIYW